MSGAKDEASPLLIPAKPYNWPQDASLSKKTTALLLIDMQRDFCEDGGYMDSQGHSIAAAKAIIPTLASVLDAFRNADFPSSTRARVSLPLSFHSPSHPQRLTYPSTPGHRPDLSTLHSRDRYRSQLLPPHHGIGHPGPMGRLLVRGEQGQDIVSALCPREGEPIIDKPSRGAFTYTDLELLLRVRGVRNLVVGGVTTDVCVRSTIGEAVDRGFDVLVLRDGCAAVEEEFHDALVRSVVMEGGILGAVGSAADVVSVLREHVRVRSQS
ncbi:hypothetical protein MRB53_039296 [Persea americana]|nr:hypothetical protein MRB53_039296 [Persea americana]